MKGREGQVGTHHRRGEDSRGHERDAQKSSLASSLRARFMPTGAAGGDAAAGDTGDGTCSLCWIASSSTVLLSHAMRESGGGSQLYVHT